MTLAITRSEGAYLVHIIPNDGRRSRCETFPTRFEAVQRVAAIKGRLRSEVKVLSPELKSFVDALNEVA